MMDFCRICLPKPDQSSFGNLERAATEFFMPFARELTIPGVERDFSGSLSQLTARPDSLQKCA
jgi:hypothetical protein